MQRHYFLTDNNTRIKMIWTIYDNIKIKQLKPQLITK